MKPSARRWPEKLTAGSNPKMEVFGSDDWPLFQTGGFSGSMSIILGTVPLLYLVFVCSFSKILTTKIITIITNMFVISWSSRRKSMFSFQSLPSGKLTWQEKMDLLKMYSLLKMGIFHCCQEGVFICDFQPYIPQYFWTFLMLPPRETWDFIGLRMKLEKP